ncbi:MAG: GNAT family N-acetyltransferase [Pseudomonadota bacterium]
MLRNAITEDAQRIAEIHIRTWQVAYAGIMPGEHLASLSIETRTENWRKMLSQSPNNTLVAEENDTITGWISYGPCRDEDDADKGEVYAIYILPEYWGQGYGEALLTQAETNLQRLGYQVVTLWVLEDNHRARRFYENRGYQPDGKTQEDHQDNVTLLELRYASASKQ